MNIASPLRYPGGKATLYSLLKGIRRLNDLGGYSIAEPFAGGAGASLTLLYREETSEVLINDLDPAIHDFWWSLLNRYDAFSAKVRRTRVSMREWYRQRAAYRSKDKTSRLNRGFAAFYLNRCNRSGIIRDGGPIGGINQKGKWKLNARFNKTTLLERCSKVAEYRDRISLSQLDGRDVIVGAQSATTLLFVDPPYFQKGPELYLNGLDAGYHAALADSLRSVPSVPWVLTYDDCPEIRRLYRGWAKVRPYSLRYAAARRRLGNEVLITPKWMKLPQCQRSMALDW